MGVVVAEGVEMRRLDPCVSEGSKKRKIKCKKTWVLCKYIHTLISVNRPYICSTA